MKIKRVEHIAIAVDSMKQSLDLMRDTFGLELEYEEQIGQTRLAMLPVGQTYIELLEGQGPESGVTKWIAEKGTGLFHILLRSGGYRGRDRRVKSQEREAAERHVENRSWRIEDRVPGPLGDRECGDRTRRTRTGTLSHDRVCPS